jgi:transposase
MEDITQSLNFSLQNKTRTKQKISDELRKLIIDEMNSGSKPKKVAEIFKVQESAVRKIYKTFQKDGRVTKKKTGKRRSKLSDEQKEKLCDWVDDDCQLTLQQLVAKCFEEWQIVLSPSTVARGLKHFHYSFKRVTLNPERRNSRDVIEKRYQYALQYNRLMAEREKMYFLDETGIQIFSRNSYGRSPKGTRATKNVASIRSRNYSIATAMNHESLYMFEIQDQAYNSEDYVSFLSKLFEHLRLDGVEGAHIIMDNVRFHKTDSVVNLIRAHGHNPIFLPPHSPFLNPIENMFNQWKSMIRRSEPVNEDQLYQSVHSTSERISSLNCSNYFKNMEKYLFPCLNREIIDN